MYHAKQMLIGSTYYVADKDADSLYSSYCYNCKDEKYDVSQFALSD
jgi:hypothetical protein